jgi:hypothetical protein
MLKKIILSSITGYILSAAQFEYSIGMGKYHNDIKSYNLLNLKIGQYKNKDLLKISLEQSFPIKINNKNYYLTKLEFLYNKSFQNDFFTENNLYPYAIGGIGGMYSTTEKLDSGILASIGIGFKYMQNIKTSNNLFFEIKVDEDFANKKIHYGIIFGIDYRFNYNLSVLKEDSFNKTKKIKTQHYIKKPIISKVNYSILDSDKDGVINALDECPNTPLNVTINNYGCPIDSDRDGIADYIDKCPFSPFGIKVNRYGCAIDSDRDGVVDSFDKCPNTPIGVKVDKYGCPKFRKIHIPTTSSIKNIPTKIKITPPKDSDNDGVIDSFDKCPNTPIGVVVDANGCMIKNIDSDKDGVIDSIDKCPNTLPGAKVDKYGCIYEFDFKIKFKKNSTKINPIYWPRIKIFADFLKTHPKYSTEIQGYTDNKGSAKYNKILSEKRAKAVYNLLIKFGINPERLSYFGYGEKNPIYPNGINGNPKNRRVVAKLYRY